MWLQGPAQVNIKSIHQCENPEQNLIEIYLTQKKINRTHDVINGNVSLPIDWDDNIKVNIINLYKVFEKYKSSSVLNSRILFVAQHSCR